MLHLLKCNLKLKYDSKITSICIFDAKEKVFYPITKDGIDRNTRLQDSARFWKKLNCLLKINKK